MKMYIAGPMSGLPQSNYPAFYAAAEVVRLHGYEPLNPAENDSDTSKPWEYYIRLAINQVLQAEAVALLPGWRKSRGANLEFSIGKALGLKFFAVDLDGRCLREFREETICEEADRLVSCDRQDIYGHPFHDFGRTALLWTGVLRDKLKDGESVEAREVGLMQICVKLSREVNTPKRDNLTDIAGYAKCVDLVNNFKT